MEFNLKLPCTNEEIKTEVTKLRAEIELRQSEIKMLGQALHHYQSQCKHPGQVTGYNERDGSWANPCPICGSSR